MRATLMSLLLLIALATSAQAQWSTGSIEGFVRDLNGKPIANATVYGYRLDNVRQRVTATTDASGRYTFAGVPAGGYNIHAFKESEGYADTIFSFFANGNKKAWRAVSVQAGRKTRDVNLALGPKYSSLKISIRDQDGKPSGASLTFTRMDDPQRPYQRGGDLSGELTMLVPAVPFRVRIERPGYKTWNSERISPQPGGTVSLDVRLLPAR